MKNKRGIEFPASFMGWFILGIFILITILIVIMILRGKLTDGIDYFRSLLRFGKT